MVPDLKRSNVGQRCGQIVRLCFWIVDQCSPIVSWAGFSARASEGQSSGADDHKSGLKSGREGPIFRSGPKGANYVICGLR